MEDTDKNLIDAHINGDAAAFAELIRRYGDGLLGYLMRICSDRQQAEDIFQETFKRVHEKANMFRGDGFKNWLYTIASRIAIDDFRRSDKVRLVSLNQTPDCDGDDCPALDSVIAADESCDPSLEAQKAEQAAKVRLAVESLPDRQRITLVLAYYQQLSYPEVAKVLDCSVGTVKTQMFRALKTLAQKLPDV